MTVYDVILRDGPTTISHVAEVLGEPVHRVRRQVRDLQLRGTIELYLHRWRVAQHVERLDTESLRVALVSYVLAQGGECTAASLIAELRRLDPAGTRNAGSALIRTLVRGGLLEVTLDDAAVWYSVPGVPSPWVNDRRWWRPNEDLAARIWLGTDALWNWDAFGQGHHGRAERGEEPTREAAMAAADRALSLLRSEIT